MAAEFSQVGVIGHREYIENIYQNSFSRIKIGHPTEIQIAKLIPNQNKLTSPIMWHNSPILES